MSPDFFVTYVPDRSGALVKLCNTIYSFTGNQMFQDPGTVDAVKAVLNPVFSPFIPHRPFGAAVFFALLAPLAIYRGPFSAALSPTRSSDMRGKSHAPRIS